MHKTNFPNISLCIIMLLIIIFYFCLAIYSVSLPKTNYAVSTRNWQPSLYFLNFPLLAVTNCERYTYIYIHITTAQNTKTGFVANKEYYIYYIIMCLFYVYISINNYNKFILNVLILDKWILSSGQVENSMQRFVSWTFSLELTQQEGTFMWWHNHVSNSTSATELWLR